MTEIIEQDVSQYYTIRERLYANEDRVVARVIRKDDDKYFVVKHFERSGNIEELKNECKLYDSIQSDYVMRPHEIYLWN